MGVAARSRMPTFCVRVSRKAVRVSREAGRFFVLTFVNSNGIQILSFCL